MTTSGAYALVDWGTTSFRVWSCAPDGSVLGERRASDGLTSIADGDFEGVLERHMGALGLASDAPAILCGMVGSRTGWQEAAYLSVPTRLDDLAAKAIPVVGAHRPVHILPGLAQRSDRPDVMRGEETQLLGVVAEGFSSGLVCMPGTHSKWVLLDDGSVAGFATFMTGELFQLLRTQSILKQALDPEAQPNPADPAFVEGFKAGFERPMEATNALFGLRAGWLLNGAEPASQAQRLSGQLIGLEFAGALNLFGQSHAMALLASGPIGGIYEAAFDTAAFSAPRRFDADLCVRHGLRAAATLLHPDRSSI